MKLIDLQKQKQSIERKLRKMEKKFTEITPNEYVNLVDPEFIRQSSVENGKYHVIVKSQGIMYKVQMTLY